MINIYAANKLYRGPGKVYQNLIGGLEQINKKYCINDLSKISQKSLILQDIGEHACKTSKDSFFGPNIFVLPSDKKEVCEKYSNFIVPSKWVKDKYETFDCMEGNNIWIWPVGVDTDYWKPPKFKDFELDCFVYYKNRSLEELKKIAKFLHTNKFSFKIVQYGNYSEEQLKELCEKSRFCILLDGSESQGLAVMEMMSSNLPLYVLDKDYWESEEGKVFHATSIPYFDERCGRAQKAFNEETFSKFILNLPSYCPREYILENHTLEQSARNLLSIYES